MGTCKVVAQEQRIAAYTVFKGAGIEDSPQRTTSGQVHFTPLKEDNGINKYKEKHKCRSNVDFVEFVDKTKTKCNKPK